MAPVQWCGTKEAGFFFFFKKYGDVFKEDKTDLW